VAEIGDNLQQALFRVEPTRGLVEYTKVVKPYHTKILDVLVEYLYEEKVTTTLAERWSWNIQFRRPDVDLVYGCGFGYVWDDASSVDANPLVIIDDIVPGHHRIMNVIPTNGLTPGAFVMAGNVLSSFPEASEFRITSNPYAGSALTLPANIQEFTVIAPPTYVNGRTIVPVAEVLLSTSLDAGQGFAYGRTDETTTFANSFLVTAADPVPYNFAVSNLDANQCVLVDRVPVTAVNVGLQRWTIAGNKVADVTVGGKIHITGNLSSVDGAYTVQSVAFSAGNTIITVVEPIFTGATAIGYLAIPIKPENVYTVISVTPGLKQWVVQGSHSVGILPGQVFEVAGNIAGNGTYTVQSVTEVSGDTVITVQNTIDVGATASGTISIQRLPRWTSGIKVKVDSTGILPTPLNSFDTFYFIPQATLGTFNIAYKRYPLELDDFVDLTTLGTEILQIRRGELYYPGATIKVANTYNSANDKTYTVRDTRVEGAQHRIFTMQTIDRPHGGNASIAGSIVALINGFDQPVYCPLASAGDIHTDAYIHEVLSFAIEMSPMEFVGAQVTEQDPSTYGFGVSYNQLYGALIPYGSAVDDIPSRVAVTSGLPTSDGAYVLLPMGYDTQLWDVGGMGENIPDVQNFYERILP
jgi:hypothetical protein